MAKDLTEIELETMTFADLLADIVQMELVKHLLQEKISAAVKIPSVHLQKSSRAEGDHDLLPCLSGSFVHLGNDTAGPRFRVRVLFQEFFMGTQFPDNTGRAAAVRFPVALQHIVLHGVF